MATDLIAFLDESRKPVRDPATARAITTAGHYVVAGAVVLDGTLDEVRAAVDQQVLQRLLTAKAVPGDRRIGHVTKAEAILSIADVLAGARSDYLCGADREAYSILAHRVLMTRRAFRDA